MPELCLSGSTKSPHFSNLILSDLKLFFLFIHSHPLYFCYIIFFSPYIFKLFSFLSPLFITTSLLLLGFLTVCPQSKGDFLFSAYRALTEKLTSKTEPKNDDFCQFEELEMYKIVFDTSAFYQIENSDEEDPVLRSEQNRYENSSCEIPGMGLYEALNLNLEEKTVEVDWEESAKPAIEEKSLEVFLEPLEDFESMPCYGDEKKSELPSVDTDEFDVKKEVLPKNTGSNEIMGKAGGDIVKLGTLSDSSSSRALDLSLGSYGSMRREKEWTRTLACKLFEERHRGDSEEGMDLLWETYENDSSNKGKKTKSNMKNKNKKKIDSEFCYEDDSDENEVVSPQLCCLQALKFSTSKMNLGMGRPNIVKISKAIKGFGWLHHVTRRSKKSYTSNRLVN